jgi:hypothetical protein
MIGKLKTRVHTNKSVLHITERGRKHGAKYDVLVTIHWEEMKHCKRVLSISVLPEDDPVGSKHVAPHFKCCFSGFNDTVTH